MGDYDDERERARRARVGGAALDRGGPVGSPGKRTLVQPKPMGGCEAARNLGPGKRSLTQNLSSAPRPLPASVARRAGGERGGLDPATPDEPIGGELDGAMPPDGGSEFHDNRTVQVHGIDAAPSTEETREIAAAGVAGVEARLPHTDAIQASFGRHDVSGIRAAVGGPAASATRAIGATAYAIGNRIAFHSAPDLRTAAHEAAHVVQQRAGVKDLAGGVGAAGDQHEQQADEIADAVVAGVSAEALLGPTGGDSGVVDAAVVQRKEPGAAPSAVGRGKGDRELAAGQHYKVVGPYAYLLDVAWYSEGAVAQGSNLISVAKTIEILSYLRSAGMFGWATPQALAAAASTIGIPVGLTRPEITMRIGAGVLAVIGLPPNSSAMVSREGDGLHIAVRLETDGLDIGSTIPIDGSSVDAVYRGLEKFTGIPIPAAQRVETFKMNVGTGAVHKRVSSGDLENLFGASAWKAWKSEHSEAKAGAAGAQEAVGAQSVANELTATEQGRLRAWLKDNVGASSDANVDETFGTRELLAMVDDIENGSLKRYRAGILDYLRAHRASEGGVAVTPRSFRASIDRAMRHSLGAEHNAVNADSKLAPILEDALPATLTYSRALALDGDTVRFAVAFDWAVLAKKQSGLYEQSERGDEFHRRPWNAEVEWVFERLDGPPLTDVERTHHNNKEMHLDRTMKLLPRETEGTWAIHAFVRTSHFPMTRVTTQIRVTSEATRMAELRAEALGELATPDKLQFDGERMSGPLAGTPRTPADRARGRADEITRLEEVKRYLELHSDGRNADAIAAVDVQLGRRREQDKKLVEDTADGWRTFDVRATYLSKVDEVPSGSLDIYGAVKRTSQPGIPGEHIVVKLRDVSRRFEQEVYEFEGIGATFEAALQDATKHLTKDYPRGRIALLAEEQDPTGQRSTGKTVGFERETYSTWKAVKEKVFHPALQLVVAAASAAVMIFVPPAAAIIPLFIETVYGGVQTVDDLLARADNHTLTMSRMAIDLGTIGLSILPFASAAKSVRSSRRAMFALEVANMGGQVLLMAANVKEHLAMLQASDVAMVAQMYGELLEAEKTYQPSDPRLAELRAQVEARANDVRNRVRDAFSTVVGTQMMFMIPGHVFKAIQVGRTHVESGWVPGDLGTPVEETDWAGLHREMSGDPPSAVPGARPTTHPVVTTNAPKVEGTPVLENTAGPARAHSGESAATPVATKPGSSAAAERWLEHLNSQLDPDARVRLRESSKGKSAQEVMDAYGGDFDAASKQLESKAAVQPPDTADKFTVGELPKGGPPRWKYLDDPAHWTSERAALHDRLIENAKAQARAFAETLAGKEPTLFAMRGNTAAGKTRAVSANVPELAGPMAQTAKLPHRAINPDNFKADLIKATPGATSTDVHSESSMLSGRLEREMLGTQTADGKPASMLIDKRLLGVDDVRGYAELAKTSGRKFVLFDVDAPLEQSLVGVLERAPGRADPLPPFNVVASGFEAVRENRADVRALFSGDAAVGEYHLFGTTPTGDRIEIASIKNGQTSINNPELYRLAMTPAEQSLAGSRINRDGIAVLAENLPSDRATKIRAILEKYEGWTWKAALDAHSREKGTQ